MDESSFIEVSVAQARDFYPKGHFIGEDFLVYEHFSEVPLPWKSCRMQCLFFALCTQGEASYTVDAKASRIKQGDVIIVGEGQLIENFLASDDCDGIAIMISYDIFNDIEKGIRNLASDACPGIPPLISSAFSYDTVAGIRDLNTLLLFSRLHPVFSLTEREANVLSSYIDTIIAKILEPEHHFRRELVSTLMKALIYDMSNVIYRYQMGEKKRFSRGEVVFFNYIRLVRDHFKQERRVSWYAHQLCITPKYLSETIKTISKRTPNEWIDYYVVLELRLLLKNSDKSIKEIAEYLNFPNQSFLGKLFKDHVGVSPSTFRKS